jgi:endonuclease/exonuclease/phosphatase family metal-dependent hydrolase
MKVWYTSLLLIMFILIKISPICAEPLRLSEEAMAMSNASPTILKVATFNIHHGQGTDGYLNLMRIAEVIRALDVDIIGLQEVDKNWGNRSQGQNQLAFLSGILDMEAHFGPALSRKGEQGYGYYGNGVLSKHPIIKARNHHLKRLDGSEDRAFIETLIRVGDKKMVFITVHLGLSEWERHMHLNQLLERVDESDCPVVVVGDFNSPSDSELIEMMGRRMTDAFAVAGRGEGVSFVNSVSSVRIDYIWVSKDFEVLESRTFATIASDHYPVTATLRFK